jgi:sugar-specific transcriptional regulator TrmB
MTTEGLELFELMEHQLNEWLARAVEPPAVPPPQPADSAAARMFEERLKRLQSYLDRAEREAEQASALLENEIHSTRSWLEAFKEAREKLSECTTRQAG